MSEYHDDPYGLDADDEEDTYAREVIFGVAGPGDEWTSHGPGGMSSAQHQAAQQKAAAAASEPGFFDTLFGDDEEPLVAEEGAAGHAADQVIDNVFDDKGGIQFGEVVSKPKPGGGGFAAPASSSASTSSASAAPGFPVSKGTGAILLGIAAGVLFFMVKK